MCLQFMWSEEYLILAGEEGGWHTNFEKYWESRNIGNLKKFKRYFHEFVGNISWNFQKIRDKKIEGLLKKKF